MEKDKIPIKNTLLNISKDISELENEKNLGKIVKEYNKINSDIKNASSRIHTLRHSFENNDFSLNDNKIKEEEYQEFLKELSEEEINKLINCDDLELQIEDYKKLLKKLNSCKEYLETKKINIIECDKNVENKEKEKEKEKEKKIQNLKPKPKIKSKVKKVSSSSSSSTKSNSSSGSESSD